MGMISPRVLIAVELEYPSHCSECFGLWVNCLWFQYGGFSFEENREAFFWLLKKLLDEGKVRFCRPDDPLGNSRIYWDADSDTIVAYLQSQWPPGVTNENDPALNLYFFEIPAILWVGEDGELYGS